MSRGKCPGGYMSGGKYPGGTCPGGFVLSPMWFKLAGVMVMTHIIYMVLSR